LQKEFISACRSFGLAEAGRQAGRQSLLVLLLLRYDVRKSCNVIWDCALCVSEFVKSRMLLLLMHTRALDANCTQTTMLAQMMNEQQSWLTMRCGIHARTGL
jgi:hypothetical protein